MLQKIFKVDQGSFKGLLSNFKEVSRECQGCFEGVSWKFEACFRSVSKVFQGSFKKMFKVFHRRLMLHVTHRSSCDAATQAEGGLTFTKNLLGLKILFLTKYLTHWPNAGNEDERYSGKGVT